jgi:hypothetical protein
MVFLQCKGSAGTDTGTVVDLMPVYGKIYTIEFVQAIICGKPHITEAVFKNGIDAIGRETVFTAEVDEVVVVGLGRYQLSQCEEESYECSTSHGSKSIPAKYA